MGRKLVLNPVSGNFDYVYDEIPAVVPAWSPSVNGYLAASYDPDAITTHAEPTTGRIELTRIDVPYPITATNVVYDRVVVNVGGSGQCFIGIYNSAGVRVAVTADLAVAWATGTGLTSHAFTAPVALPAGYYYVAVLKNGAGLRIRNRLPTSGFPQYGTTNATARFASNLLTQTSLVTPLTLSSSTPGGFWFWWAIT